MKNDADRDLLYFTNKKGRYAPGGKWENATQPMEGGTAAAGYVPKAAKITSRPQAMYRNHSGEPEALGTDAIPYAPPRMERIAGESKDAPEPGTVMEYEPMAEAQDVYTPIACYLEGSPAGSVQ